MITNQNRSFWIGASDTSMVMGNWSTESFKNWWLIKLGIDVKRFKSWIMDCGNIIEIPIIRAIERLEAKKIKIGRFPYYNIFLRLRVNYDGFRKDEVIEIKTTGKAFKSIPKSYRQQCQVLMYRKRKKLCALYEYQMQDVDYLNPYFPDIDLSRLKRHEIEYDREFIENEYLPRLRYLASCLRLKKFPKVEEYVEYRNKKCKRLVASVNEDSKRCA